MSEFDPTASKATSVRAPSTVDTLVGDLDRVLYGLRDTIRHMKQFDDYAALTILVRADADELQRIRDGLANAGG